MFKKKVLLVNWFRAPSKLLRFIKANNIKKKDIVSIGRNPRDELEVFYYGVPGKVKDIL